uniref:CHK kinase-like domain-containing protein n=1 Tax=Ceratitis capitata TaxID=7213 RepID=W8C404_CERCA
MSTADTNAKGKTESKAPVSNAATDGSGAAAAAAAARQVPEWLKADLFLDLLKKNVPDFKAVKSFNAKPAQNAGENYATLMALVQMEVELRTGKTKPVSYMLKLPIESVQKLMQGINIFYVESTMYRDVIPELEKFYSDVGVDVKFTPQFYELKTPSEFGVILMEDLRVRGFKNANRLEGFDMEHTKNALKKLAQWHAASAVRIAVKGKYPKIVSTGIFTEEFINMMKAMNQSSTQLFNECVRTYKGHEVYIKSMERGQEKVFENFIELINPDPNDFNVLNHGDFWANNIMFQYDAFEKIKETYFVDFQCSRYGSPVHDLYNLLIASTSYEIKLKNFDYFIKYYHDHLVENLKLLKYTKKFPVLKDIHIALYKYGIFGLAACSGHMAIVLLDPTEMATIDNLLGNTPDGVEFKKLMYTNERYRKHAEDVLPWLYYRGAFE